MNEETLCVGDTVRHADAGDTAIVQSFPYYPYAVVRWESTGRESTENLHYLVKAN